MDNRNAYWDSIKGLLIFIVVLGHSLEMDRVDRINLTTYELIYSFHMPLFMFLSGLFTNPNPERNKFKKSLFRIIETYIVFNLLYMVFYMDFPTTLIDAFTPYDVMWYLYILIIFRVCLYIYTERISHKIMPLFMGSIIVATLIGYIPFIGDKLCASRFFYFMPFFLAGILLKHKLSDWRPRFSLIHKMGAVLFLAITFTSIYLINNPDYFILLGAKSYNELDVRGLMGGGK